MDGRGLLGALIRFFGFIVMTLPALLFAQQALQLIAVAIALSSSKQPGAGDVITQSLQQSALPMLQFLVVFAVGMLILRNGDAIAGWAYASRKGRAAPSTTPAAKPVRKTTTKSADE